MIPNYHYSQVDSMNVLITGANGFIGGRVAELLQAEDTWSVRAGVRRLPPGDRLAALPVEVAQCDIMRPEELSEAVAGMNAVVHCARGPEPVMVQGTRNVLDAALAAGVDRVVHLSTIDVYGPATGEVLEDAPLAHTGAEYGDSKVEAEAVCREFLGRGLDVVILRPTIVYGPFSDSWTLEFVERLQSRPWPFPREVSQGTCNLLYVDDLVQAIRLALTEPAAVGEAFNVNGPERPTWYEYFAALNERLGLPPLEGQSSTPGPSGLVAGVTVPVRAVAKFGFRHFGGVIELLRTRSRLVERALKSAEKRIRAAPNAAELELYGRPVSFPAAKARKVLGYRPEFDMDRGLARTVDWLEASGIHGSSDSLRAEGR
jgi:UDP-glucose 4-epimerase